MESILVSGLELLPTRKRKPIKNMVEQVVQWEKLPQEMISVCFVSDKDMRALQKQWRHKNVTTDVLSFPAHGAGPVMPGTEHMLGDIAICVDQAMRQAQKFGHSLEEEMAVLMAHGFLHVLGFDHELSEEQALMQMQGEMTILDMLGLSPALSLLGRTMPAGMKVDEPAQGETAL